MDVFDRCSKVFGSLSNYSARFRITQLAFESRTRFEPDTLLNLWPQELVRKERVALNGLIAADEAALLGVQQALFRDRHRKARVDRQLMSSQPVVVAHVQHHRLERVLVHFRAVERLRLQHN